MYIVPSFEFLHLALLLNLHQQAQLVECPVIQLGSLTVQV